MKSILGPDKEGMMSFEICLDCGWKHTKLAKLYGYGKASRNHMAVICMNPLCRRFTQLANLMTWKKV